MEDNNRITLLDCGKSSSKLMKYLKEKGENHKQYKRYAYRSRQIDNLDKCQFILSGGEKWNDKVDAENFQSRHPGKKVYGICFSVSTKENVAMWIIYADFSEEGMMISYSNKILKEIIAPYREGKKEIEIGHFENGEFVTTRKMKLNEEDIFLADIVYSSDAKDKNQTRFTRADEHAYGDVSVKEEIPYLFKEYSWFYEKECRLIIAIDEDETHPLDKYVRLTYPKEINDRLKESKSIVESPNYELSEYAVSELKGKVNFEDYFASRKNREGLV